MELLSGAEMVVRSLRDEGVKYIYGYPGGALLHIYDALFKEPEVTHILVRHEQAATHMADGYARATGKAGVVLVTSGPGATNAITGIATAYMDSIPMVIISGQVPSTVVGTDAFQETDMVGISRPIVKHSFIIKHPSEIPEVIKKAFYLAESGRPGPVVVDIPKDMGDPSQKYEYSYPKKVKLRSYSPAARGHSGQIRKAVETLLAAKRPIVYSGGGVVMGGASEPLTELARMLNVPVTNTLMGLGAYPGTDRQFVGMLGMHGSYTANLAMHHADVILAVGARFDDRVINGETAAKFCPNAKIIHIDIDPASISKTVKADIPIVGPVDSVLTEMVAILREIGETPNKETVANWWKQIDEWRGGGRLFPYNEGDGSIIKPQTVIETLSEVTKGDAYITSDVGQHQMFAAQYYRFNKPNRWINSGGLGTMGFGFPAAMGVKLNFPEADVACVTGEGSIQMNIQELSTCLQYDLPVKIVNLNNGALGMVRQWQDMQYSSRYSHSYMESLPDFVKLAEAYGHVGIRITDLKDLKPKMEEAFAMKNRLVFLDIAVDTSEHVYPMQIRGGAMRDMWLSKTERT
ncbi:MULTISPECIES: acetolactate synthase 3 large subunit [Pseudomonas]|uniref:acetolactate synthase 3 large subunit n=1 Tax=Pseudomonas TaxID=286 RepID=UPI001C81EEB2|nr:MULTISPECIES: acetolactate synthase 3 large subunit [Pseudomonas]MDG9929935.1 acetolactate synthase 3 large subunit [Pseudomonas sp. GD04042]MDH0485014.1 acetolactate synthase 3 large subunit [Pseudomonas sp. GD04015]MDH0606422.1 acetolactate synthase 3 large subunit [Pseudomonas sp. GD03869]MDH0896768.1 acetolactate synthase 3 large subunit [Pseudomonas sp. GD03875]MDH1066579.1 acetolactate synthase 3 large subunit [Pseudomonas sp. GD03985]